jgi:nicotinamide-nucleotide amidase
MSAKPPRIAVVGIGTELTSGQILNSNAQWISRELRQRGLQVFYHMTVPDERSVIRETFAFLASRCELIFVTGGLGPTSDDFTRELISEWAGRPLEFDAPSWEHIQNYFAARERKATEYQKKQCYFPRGSRVLINRVGTANGFRLTTDGGLILYSLPGPPREVAAIWRDDIDTDLRETFPQSNPYVTQSWDILGKGESEIAARLEPLLSNCPFEIGYRVHLPYVEFKIGHYQSQLSEVQVLIDQIQSELAGWTVLFNQPELPWRLFALLENCGSVNVVDTASQGRLIERLFAAAKETGNLPKIEWLNHTESKKNSPLTLKFMQKGRDHYFASWSYRGTVRTLEIPAEFSAPGLMSRNTACAIERALLFWCMQCENSL